MKTIVYTSGTGYTAQYAKMLGEKLGISAMPLEEAKNTLLSGEEVIYFGWLMAGFVSGYKEAKKKFSVSAVCAVGMGENVSQTNEIRKSNKISDTTPLFVLQGGLDMSKLNGVYKFMMKIVTKKIEKDLLKKETRSQEEENILTMIREGGNFVSEENLAPVIEWYNKLYIII